MTTINIGKEGPFIIDQDTNINMDGHQEDGAAWNPTIADMFVEGGFSSTILPGDTVNYLWNSIGWEWEYFSGDSDPSAEILVQLVGIKQDLNESQPLYEYQVTPTYPFNVTENKTIQLNDSGSNPNLIIRDTSAGAGKIRINLPNRWSNYLNAVLTRPWLNGYSKRKSIPITGSTSGVSVYNQPLEFTIAYDSDMQSDFDDIRFTDRDGVTDLDYELKSKTDSSTATFMVQTVEIEASPNIDHIFVYYGNSTATSNSDPFSVYNFYEDWEDGLYTGRVDSVYTNWTLTGGTVAFETSTPLSGTNSLKHTGSGLLLNTLQSTPNLVTYTLKLTTQGTGTSTPYITLWSKYLDSTHYLSVYTLYNSGTNKQRLGIGYQNGASWTSIYEMDWTTGKAPLNGTWDIGVVDTGSIIQFWFGAVNMFTQSYTLPFTPLYLGIGAVNDTQIMIDTIKDYPYYAYPPTVGTVGSEESTQTITYDTVSDEDQQYITFTTPADWTLSQPAYLTLTDLDNTELRTHEAEIKPTNTVNMAPHCPTGFYALRLKFNIKGTDEMGVNISSVNGSYEYLEDLK